MDKIDRINVWYDNAWPHLDVVWLRRIGYLTATENDNLDAWVDLEGNVLGFMLTGIRRYKGKSFTANLRPVAVAELVETARLGDPGISPLVENDIAGNSGQIEQIHFQFEESGDCLEVRWASTEAVYTDTTDERVQGLADAAGNVLGFKISGITLMGEGERDFINVDLHPINPEAQPAKPNS